MIPDTPLLLVITQIKNLDTCLSKTHTDTPAIHIVCSMVERINVSTQQSQGDGLLAA